MAKVGGALFAPLIVLVGLCARALKRESRRPRLVFGSVPIINNLHWARAMRAAGYEAETFTSAPYSIHSRNEWDRVDSDRARFLPRSWRPYFSFLHALFLYDVFVIPFSGFFIGDTPLKRLQHVFFRIAGSKVVVIPYGADAYVYRRVHSAGTQHALLSSYPRAARLQSRIAKDVDYWVRWADCVIPGFMGPDGIGRWDVLVPNPLYIDLDVWAQNREYSAANGVDGEVVIVHAPNHRGFKGSEFVISAVERLRAEGLAVRLILLEGVKNEEVRRVLREEADILVEQLVFQGHGFNAIEGMASGLPVVANFEDDQYMLPMRRWAYFEECPAVSASPESIVCVLRRLVTDADLRRNLGVASRRYAEKYHGYDSAQFLFREVLEFVNGDRPSLVNLFHPLTSEYVKRSAKVTHPLIRNRIPA